MRGWRIGLAAGLAALGMACAAAAQTPAQQVLDRMLIEEVIAKYQWALDSGDADGYAALFTEDGVLAGAGGRETKGRAAIAKEIRDLSARFRATPPPAGSPARKVQHIGTNLVIELKGDTATAKSYWTEVWNLRGPVEVAGGGHYNDTLVKKNGQWFFSRRENIGDLSAPRAAPAAAPARPAQ
jgi:uncharacterized protein (TIGR02246 family)